MSSKQILLCISIVISIGLVSAALDYQQLKSTSIGCPLVSSHNERIHRPPGRLNDNLRNKPSYGRLREGDEPSDTEVLALLDRVLPKDCGQAPNSSFKPYVSGGFNAEPGDYPSFVKIIGRGEYFLYPCGGTIISNRHVLTAAHCVKDEELISREVVTGMRSDDAGAKRYQIGAGRYCSSALFSDKEGEGFLNYDLALLTIAGDPIEFDDLVQPACLPREPATNKGNLRAVGLGRYSDEQPNLIPETLQVLPVRVEKCEPEDVHLSKVCFVSSDPKHVGDTCSGDSGAPIYGYESGKMTVVAATSYGPTQCRAGEQGKSVNTDFYATRTEIGGLMLKCGGLDLGEQDEEQPAEPPGESEEPEEPEEEPETKPYKPRFRP